MIKLTDEHGNATYISPDNVTAIAIRDQITNVWTCDSGRPMTVKETPEEVTRKILEYKLAMVRYKESQHETVKHHGDPIYLFECAEDALRNLAGLEDSGHDQ
ncbi:hypothetical protein [Cohnella cholangitidis]|uniref:Flagellar protein FlbD n=1 Tax=Cohnella cholangitidis TaxID=2598458 RepID=A0A7G5C3E3_9BACL|nr:hypothetical protein [Cohnella cholangitidis]QMV43727.1 hypothetical protein FPL14_23050 [Cohnella cholangitidis]